MVALIYVYAFMEFIYAIRKKDGKALKRAGIALVMAVVIELTVLMIIS